MSHADIAAERQRQHAKHGDQPNGRHRPLWAAAYLSQGAGR